MLKIRSLGNLQERFPQLSWEWHDYVKSELHCHLATWKEKTRRLKRNGSRLNTLLEVPSQVIMCVSQHISFYLILLDLGIWLFGEDRILFFFFPLYTFFGMIVLHKNMKRMQGYYLSNKYKYFFLGRDLFLLKPTFGFMWKNEVTLNIKD